MPRILPDALLEGLAWDAMGRRYATLSDLRAYSARVASAVGAMMCVLMRVRDRDALARACDLGVAMQLTNIARDVGEDAREGRLYLPTDWLAGAGVDLRIDGAGQPLARVVRKSSSARPAATTSCDSASSSAARFVIQRVMSSSPLKVVVNRSA